MRREEGTEPIDSTGFEGEEVYEEPDEILMPESEQNVADTGPGEKLCFGCLYHDGCEPEATRAECDLDGGVWHLEDRATALEDGEVAEFVSPTALDLDEEGEIVETELEDVLKSSFDQRSMGNSSIEDIKGQILAFTGPNLTAYYMEKTGGASRNDSSPDASLLQEGRLFGAIFTVATKTVSFASHMAQGKSASSWVVNEFKDPWNYVGFVPGMKQAGKAWKGLRNIRAAVIR